MSSTLFAFLLPNLVLTAGILAVLVLRKTVRAQFGAKMGYALWILPLLAVAASFLPPRVIEIVQPRLPDMAPLAAGPEYVLPAIALPTIDDLQLEPVATPFVIDIVPTMLLLWFTGMLAMISWLGQRQALFMADVRAGKAGPAVVGFIRPRIVTPRDFDARFDEGEQRVILAHETIHLNRQDARINALVALIRCVCWYNPLVHIAAHCLRIDQELACDAAVVERHPKARRLYADALLKAQLAARPLPLGCYWPAGTEHPLMERIEMLKKSAPSKLRRMAGAVLFVALAGGAGFAAWAAMPPSTRVVLKDPQQSPAPAPAATQKIDYSWENAVRLYGTVVSVDLDGAHPTALVRGTWITIRPAEDELWTIDLTPKGRAPTQDVDRSAATVGNFVTVLGYRFDRSCTSACALWARNFTSMNPDNVRRQALVVTGIPDRYDTGVDVIMAVTGSISSIARSGSDNIITVRAKSVRRGIRSGPPVPDSRDWRFIQFDGATTSTRHPFNSQAVGMQVMVNGVPEKGADCSKSCTLAFLGSNLTLGPDGRPVVRSDPSDKGYDAATMGPPPERPNDAPSPVAQLGFNAEDYVVVRGSIVRVEGGNPVKTFWVKAREINRNYEKTQANNDIWRVDRQAVAGAFAPGGEFRVGTDVRVDGYVSTNCQPECRIQPMLIDLAQQASALPQPVPPTTPGLQPIRFEPQQSFKPDIVTITGRIQQIELDNPTSHIWVKAESAIQTRDGRQTQEPNRKLYRIAVGSKDQAPDWARDQASIGVEVRAAGYESSITTCVATCDLGGLYVRPLSTPVTPPAPCVRVMWTAPGIWEGCVPAGKAPPGAEADRFTKDLDLRKQTTLRGKVASRGTLDGQNVLWMRNVEVQPESGAGFAADARQWGVLLGAAMPTSPDVVGMTVGQDVVVRGSAAKNASCAPNCMLVGREVVLPNGDRLFSANTTAPPIFLTAAQQAAQRAAQQIRLDQQSAPSRAQQSIPGLVDGWIPFAKYFDAEKPLLLKGKVVGKGQFEGGVAMLWIDGASAGADKDFSSETRRWGVVLSGPLEKNEDLLDTLAGKSVTVRGYRAKDESAIRAA